MIIEQQLKKTPLYEEHVRLNARMVPFGGWEMPVQYEGIIAEYEQTRKRAAIFDISHMGEFIVHGDARETGLDEIVTQSLVDLPVKASRYGVMLNDRGGVIDDLIVFRLEEKKWFIVVNGATTQKDSEHFRTHLNDPSCFEDVSLKIGKIDIQGPLSRDVLKKIVPDIKKLEYFQFDFFDLLGENVLISRTGYTGELGYEIFYPWDKTTDLWKTFLKDERVKPAGLGARDVLRLEMGYSLYGHELEEHISPLEAGLGRFVDLNKKFIGKEALEKQKISGIKRKIIGFCSESRRSPREGHSIYSKDEQAIGQVTSGTFSPSLNTGIGLGFVKSELAVKGEKIYFGQDKNKISATITEKIFYKNGSVKT